MNQCNLKGLVNSIETMGLVDGPGIRIVIFLQGCKLRCLYCHNPEMWCLEGENLMSVDDVVSKVLKYKSYISKNGGVTFSGGEPLLQSNFVYECCKRLKEENIHVCVDTSGVGSDYETLIDLVDLFIVDIKSLDKEEYRYIAGLEIDEFYRFMDKIQSKNKKLWLRQVIVPGINDTEETVIKLAEYANSLNNVEKVELLAYHAMAEEKYERLNMKYRLAGVDNLSFEKIEHLRNVLNSHLSLK